MGSPSYKDIPSQGRDANLYSNSDLSRDSNRFKLRRRLSISHLLSTFWSVDVLAPVGVGVLALVIWQVAVWVADVPPYLLPGPILVVKTLVMEWTTLFPSLLVTLQITLTAFVAATLSGL
ncbi:MAG: hypothetical protein VKL39_23775, partial [Leptolyngbyaceae bacterium]|nr:hypothetical protein [Leptolyngbyaceae bacterium]